MSVTDFFLILAVIAVPLLPPFLILLLGRPPHTLGSVAREIVEGVENGSVILPGEDTREQ